MDGRHPGVERSLAGDDLSPDASQAHVAMLRAVVTGASMDLGMLRNSNNIHISIGGERASIDDLRLMYRYRNSQTLAFTWF